jgi:hypothetical protein
MVAEKAEKAANKREKKRAKKRKRADLRAAEKQAMKAAENDPDRLLPGLTRCQFAGLKKELVCENGVSFASWPEEEAPLPTSAAAMPVQGSSGSGLLRCLLYPKPKTPSPYLTCSTFFTTRLLPSYVAFCLLAHADRRMGLRREHGAPSARL